MGLFNAIVKVGSGGKKGASISKSSVFNLPANAHTPDSPSDWGVYQSRPEVRTPQTFTERQAMELKKRAEIQQKLAQSTKDGYKSLKQIKSSDAAINKDHYEYASHCIEQNAEIVGAKTSHANTAIEAGVAHSGMAIALDSQLRVAEKQIALMGEEFEAVWR